MFRLPAQRILSQPFRPRLSHPKFRPRLISSPVQSRQKAAATETIHVRFQELPQFRRRVFEAFIYIAAFYVFQRIVFGPFEDLDLPTEDDVKGYRKKQRNGKPTPDEVLNGSEEVDGEDDPWFIPLGFTTELPKEWYKGSDPEWKEFAKLAKDRKRGRLIEEQLVTMIRSQCAADPRVQQIIGKVNGKLGKWWLDTHYPYAPPAAYSRSGLEVGDDAITWTTRTITDVNHNRLNRALYPMATVQAVYATSAVLGKTFWHDIQTYFGYKPRRDPEILQVKRLHAQIVAHHAKHRDWGDKSNALPSSVSTTTSPSMQTPSTSPSDATNGGFPINPTRIGLGIPQSMIANVVLGRVLFLHNLYRNPSWHLKSQPPRGSVVVSGSVEVMGTKGRIRFDIEATYDIKQAKYVGIAWNGQKFQPYKQVPKGGR